jgi:hypothetical protein
MNLGPFTIELTEEEILEDLCWPHPPPGQWRLEPPAERGSVSHTPTHRETPIGKSPELTQSGGR